MNYAHSWESRHPVIIFLNRNEQRPGHRAYRSRAFGYASSIATWVGV
jgi:hypothetical protein